VHAHDDEQQQHHNQKQRLQEQLDIHTRAVAADDREWPDNRQWFVLRFNGDGKETRLPTEDVA
jgi:hypothetical protein